MDFNKDSYFMQICGATVMNFTGSKVVTNSVIVTINRSLRESKKTRTSIEKIEQADSSHLLS